MKYSKTLGPNVKILANLSRGFFPETEETRIHFQVNSNSTREQFFYSNTVQCKVPTA